MKSTHDPEQLINAYLEDGLDELPERSFDAVRAAIDQTRQWAVIGPWKEPQIMTATRFALIAAAIAVVAVVAIRFLPSGGGLGPGTTANPTGAAPASHTPDATTTLAPVGAATPTESSAATPPATPTSTATPQVTAAPEPLPSTGALPAGTYYIEDPLLTNVERLTFTVPAGWVRADFATKDAGTSREVMFTAWVVSHIFTDACDWDESSIVDVGTTADHLLSALADQKSRTASRVTETTVAGYAAKQITLTVSPALDTATCTNGILRYWPGPGPDFTSGLCCNRAGNTDVVYAADIEGKRVLFVARHYPDTSSQSLQELQSIVDSLQIEP
jgi:hypothetical protein